MGTFAVFVFGTLALLALPRITLTVLAFVLHPLLGIFVGMMALVSFIGDD